jgi:ribosome-binding protein aMBF1 (putative translation factor)
MNNSFRWQTAFIGSISKLWKRRTIKMAKSFKNLRDKMSPASKKLSAELAGDLRGEIRLTELRNALGINQEELGELLNKKQAAISRLERRNDMHVSTLREFIKALGGKLEIIATFPDASYHIKQFEQE